MSRAVKTMAGIAMIALSASALGALVAAPHLRPPPVPLDQDTLCPLDRPVTGHTIILVDRTDRYSAGQLSVLREAIAKARRDVPTHGRLSIHLLTADAAEAEVPIITLCNPGDGSTIDPLTGNPRRARERFEAGFNVPLDRVLADLAEPQEAARSPIIEAIARLSSVIDFQPAISHRRLVLISDLLQHVPGHSHYRELRDVDAVMQMASGRHLAAAGLRGVQVELVYLHNAKAAHRQGAEHLAFWANLLARVGASVVQAPETGGAGA